MKIPTAATCSVEIFSSSASICDTHHTQILARKLPLDWAEVNCKSVSAEQASQYIGYTSKSSGLLFIGETTQFQFRPDEPWKSKDGKAPKYRTPLGEYDAYTPKHPTDKDYWNVENLKQVCWRINDHPYLLITEGVFKALMGCGFGLPTIALMGVTMGLTPKGSNVQGKRYLVDVLEKYAKVGFGFIIAFDADAVTNKDVRTAERSLARQLLKFKVPVRSITGHWEPGENGSTKGMDDFIKEKGIEEFRALLVKSSLFGEDNSELDVDDEDSNKESKPPTPRKLASQIAEDYGSTWKFDNAQKCWKRWNERNWEKTEDGSFRSLLKRTVDARNIPYRGSAYITDLLSLITDDLRVEHWKEWDRKQFINFANGILDIDAGDLLPHCPGSGFTSVLPYEYKPLTGDYADATDSLRENCPSIYRWMNDAMKGDRKKMLKLLAITNGLLKFRFFDLQMFVHLIGSPGTGKGTFTRLLQKVVGRDNWKGCKVSQMADGSTMAGIINKQLVACPDERAVSGVDTILSLTGGDAISYREVYKTASDAFFHGLLLIASNNPIFVGDTTGLDRRLCLVNFDSPVSAEMRNPAIETAMDAEIAQFITVCLSLSNATVTENIQGRGDSQIAEFKLKEWEMKCQTNSTAAHFDDCLVVDPTATISTGKLYEHYKDWCENGGLKAVAHTKYPRMLSDLLTDLRIDGVRYRKTRGRSNFEGLRLRASDDENLTYSESLDGVTTGIDGDMTGIRRGSEPLLVGNYSNMTGLTPQNFPEKSDCNVDGVKPDEEKEQGEGNFLNVSTSPSSPSNPANSQPVTVSNPVTIPVESPRIPVTKGEPTRLSEAVSKVLAAKAWAGVKAVFAEYPDVPQEQIKAALTEDEDKRIGRLKGAATKNPGTRVRYIGKEPHLLEWYGGVVLVVDSVDKMDGVIVGIHCKAPDGSFPSQFKPEDLEPI